MRLLRKALLCYILCIISSTLAMECRSSASISRRMWLTSVGASTVLISNDDDIAGADDVSKILSPSSARSSFQPVTIGSDWKPPTMYTKLAQSRILAKELLPLSSSSSLSWASILVGGENNELYYPPFLFGAWEVQATLRQKIFPFGVDMVPSDSLVEGSPRYRLEQVGDTTTYQVHYFSTLANTFSNQLKVNLGLGVPSSQMIADRAYNILSMSRAYQQLMPVEEVVWDYSSDPTRLTLLFGAGSVAKDMQPLGPRRGEVYLTARQSELYNKDDFSSPLLSPAAFCAAEQSRSVTLGTRSTVVSDIETITEFHPITSHHLQAIQRVAVYLTPNPNAREGILWQQVGGKAVAFYDYELSMQRQLEDFVSNVDGSHQQRACVTTPKDVVQCY